MDALSVLRDFTVRQELGNVHRFGDEFRFGDDYRFPCATETAYRSKQGPLYTLDCLVFFVKSSNLKHTEYMQQARALKLQIVTFPDRKPLLDYLQGRVANSDAIELLPLTSAAAAAEHLHPPHHHPRRSPGGGDGDDDYASPSKRQAMMSRPDASMLIELVRGMERPVRDRDSILLCPNKTFDSILAILSSRRDEEKRKLEQQLQQPQQQQHQATQHQNNNKFVKVESEHKMSSSSAPDVKRGPAVAPSKVQQGGKVKMEGPPIILVPNASQTLLTTINAKEFLEDGVYHPADPKSSKKPDSVLIHRKIGRDMAVKYEIRDKPSSLSSKDWERVVAVFVLGKEWQFKDWPFKDHVDIFNKILGVYLRFEDDSMESVKVVMQWNVKIISLSKHKRHQDRTAVLEFWDKLDAFIRARRLPIHF